MLQGPPAFTEDSILDDLQRAAGVGVDRVDWDLNIVDTPIPVRLDALRRPASLLW
jgi:hypothetical protein